MKFLGFSLLVIACLCTHLEIQSGHAFFHMMPGISIMIKVQMFYTKLHRLAISIGHRFTFLAERQERKYTSVKIRALAIIFVVPTITHSVNIYILDPTISI
jgi:hypothetical protein